MHGSDLTNTSEESRASRDVRRLRSGVGEIRDELVELAFTLDRRGRAEAADLANAMRIRLDGLLRRGVSSDALAPGETPDCPSQTDFL